MRLETGVGRLGNFRDARFAGAWVRADDKQESKAFALKPTLVFCFSFLGVGEM
jgi:hypothetical protein